MESVIIYGAGNTGRKALETLRREGKYSCKGFIDDMVQEGVLVQGVPVLGNTSFFDIHTLEDTKLVFVAIGNNYVRKEASERLIAQGFTLVSLIDPLAVVSPEAIVGSGCLIMPNTYIGHETRVKDLAICQVGCVISHFVKIGIATNLGYQSIISAYASIGDFTKVGIGARILNKRTIGSESLIGAGAVVTRDIPSRTVAFGVPAKIIRSIDLKNFDPNKGGDV